MYGEPLPINYERSRFDAAKFNRPLLMGYTDIIGADPQTLLDRGYDKVIIIARSNLLKQLEAEALYFRGVQTLEDSIKLSLTEPKYYLKVKKKWEKLNIAIDDPRLLRIPLEHWSLYLNQTYNSMLDFLNFPKKGRLQVVPVPRDPKIIEGYSCSHLPVDHVPSKNIERIRAHVE